jgi:hypothetical protein
MRTFKAPAVYFLLVFAVGWVLGPIRELWAVPRFGRMTGVLLEGPIMLIAMIISARGVIRRFDVPRSLRTTISMGLVAVGILAAAEIAGVLWMRRLSLQEYLGSLVTGPGGHLTAYVPALCRNANARGTDRTGPCDESSEG